MCHKCLFERMLDKSQVKQVTQKDIVDYSTYIMKRLESMHHKLKVNMDCLHGVIDKQAKNKVDNVQLSEILRDSHTLLQNA